MRMMHLLVAAAAATQSTLRLEHLQAKQFARPSSRSPVRVKASGILVSPNVALSTTPIHSGQKFITINGAERRVKRVITHPKFKTVVDGNDAALYVLEESMEKFEIPKIARSTSANSFYLVNGTNLREVKILDGKECSRLLNEGGNGLVYPTLDSSLSCFFIEDPIDFERGSLVIARDANGESRAYGLVVWNFRKATGWPVGVLKLDSVWDWAQSKSEEFNQIS